MDFITKETNTPRYIDAELFKRKYLEQHEGEPGRAYYLVDEIPTADVKEVVRGHWIMDDDDILGMSFECSICHYEQDESYTYRSCPNCGADMRGGENEK